MMKNISIILGFVLTGFFGVKIYAEGGGADSSQGILNKDYANKVVKDKIIDPYEPDGFIDKMIYKVEKLFGSDMASTIAHHQAKCEKGNAGACFELALIRKDEGELFIAENYFLLSCRYGNRTSCINHEKLNEKRLEFESDMKRKRVKVEARCEDDIASACAELSFIVSYFGQQKLSDELDKKACDLGYPAACTGLSKSLYDQGDFLASEEYRKTSQKMFGLKKVVVDKINEGDTIE